MSWLLPLTDEAAPSTALGVRLGHACYGIVGRTCGSVNETQNSFAGTMGTSRVAGAANRVTPVPRENIFPLCTGRRNVASTRQAAKGRDLQCCEEAISWQG